jgi:hypothetical protein
MQAVKGIYQDGNVTLVEKPPIHETSEVLVIFPDRTKRIMKIGGLFKDYEIRDDEIERELKDLNQRSTVHFEEEAGGKQ